MQVNIGIDEAKRKEIADSLSRVLANTYLLYLKTQNFHWNVNGPTFYMLHGMFEKQYEELAEAVDEIAERIRALGFRAPASFGEFTQLATIKEEKNLVDYKQMVQQLLHDHEALAASLRAAYAVVDETNDEVTADLITGRLAEHEKTAWMLRSSL